MRQVPIDDAKLNVEDNLEEFGPISRMIVEHLKNEVETLYTQTDKAIVMVLGGMAYGDIALVPGPTLKNPKASAISPNGI